MSTRRAAPAPSAAYVLHGYDWSETSLVVDLFTREHGRLAVVAKGAKRPYSQLRPVLLPLQRLNVSLARGSGDEQAEVQTLRSADWAGGLPMPSGDALFSGFYLNELLMKLLPRHDPHPGLFDVYAATLPRLASDDEAAEGALRAFELQLLRQVGLLPDLAVTTGTLSPVQAGAGYMLHGEAGVVEAVPGAAAALDGGVLRALQAALDHGPEAALRAAAGVQRHELKAQLRGLLHYHLGSATLRSRNLLRELQQLMPR